MRLQLKLQERLPAPLEHEIERRDCNNALMVYSFRLVFPSSFVLSKEALNCCEPKKSYFWRNENITLQDKL